MRYATIYYCILILCSMGLTCCHAKKQASVAKDNLYSSHSYIATDSQLLNRLREMWERERDYLSWRDSVAEQKNVYVRDSIVTVVNEHGDVVGMERYRDRESTTERERKRRAEHFTETGKIARDSAVEIRGLTVLERNDSAAVKERETLIEPQERRFGWWKQGTKMVRTALAWVGAAAIVALILWLIKRKRR